MALSAPAAATSVSAVYCAVSRQPFTSSLPMLSSSVSPASCSSSTFCSAIFPPSCSSSSISPSRKLQPSRPASDSVPSAHLRPPVRSSWRSADGRHFSRSIVDISGQQGIHPSRSLLFAPNFPDRPFSSHCSSSPSSSTSSLILPSFTVLPSAAKMAWSPGARTAASLRQSFRGDSVRCNWSRIVDPELVGVFAKGQPMRSRHHGLGGCSGESLASDGWLGIGGAGRGGGGGLNSHRALSPTSFPGPNRGHNLKLSQSPRCKPATVATAVVGNMDGGRRKGGGGGGGSAGKSATQKKKMSAPQKALAPAPPASRWDLGMDEVDKAAQALENCTESGGQLSLNRYRALVLDVSYKPVEIINWQRAVVLDIFDKVDVLEYYDDATVRTARDEFNLPAVIRVRMYVQMGGKGVGRVPLSRGKVLLRDNYTCQYCGSKSDLTIDHIVPVSKGGLWEWENLTTACSRCNLKKGNKTLDQANMHLRSKPTEASYASLGVHALVELNRVKGLPDKWLSYLPSLGTAKSSSSVTVGAVNGSASSSGSGAA